MTRLAGRLSVALSALLAASAAAHAAGAPAWRAVPAAAALVVAARALLAALRGALADRAASRAADAAGTRSLRLLAQADAVARGLPGFTAADGGLPLLEACVLFGGADRPLLPRERDRLEAALRVEIARARTDALAALVHGVRDVCDDVVAALSAPLHPAHAVAPALARRLTLASARAPASLVAARTWLRRRGATDPRFPHEAIAFRLLALGYDRAALDLLDSAPATERALRLVRLARCRCLITQAARGGPAVASQAAAAAWCDELLLLAGRRLPELVAGSAFLRAVPGGAAALERSVARMPLYCAELAQLREEYPELERPVATVLARAAEEAPGAVVEALRTGTFALRSDVALQGHLRGLALLAERRFGEAVAEFEAALVRAPGFAQAAYALAQARAREGRHAEGESTLRGLVAARPRDADPALFLARYLAQVGERERAIAAYRAALDRFPGHLPLRVAYAQDLAAWGRNAEAIEQLLAARRRHPHEPRLALLSGRALAADGRLGDAAEALESAARALEGGERAEAWFWLMCVRRDQGDHTTAQRIARRLVHSLGAGQAPLLDDVAEYLEHRQDYERAREAQERARRLREGD